MTRSGPAWGDVKPPPGSLLNHGHLLARDLTNCWLFSEGAGRRVANAVPGGANTDALALETQAPAWAMDSRGATLFFTTAGQGLNAGVATRLVPANTGKMTVICWFTAAAQVNAALVSKWITAGNAANNYLLYLGQDAANAKFGFAIRQANGTEVTHLPADLSYVTRVPQHFAATADGTKLRAFLNGVGAATPTSYDGTLLASTSQALMLGQLRTGSSNYAASGWMEAAWIYSRALSAAEIQAHYSRSYEMFLPARLTRTVSRAFQPAWARGANRLISGGVWGG
jgi:hypothetical protein